MSQEEYYRQQSDRCATLATECATPNIRARLLKLAMEYENQADAFERDRLRVSKS